MVSLWDLGLLLLAAPLALAAPAASSDVSTMTVPLPKSQDTSKTTSASAIALPSSKAVSPASAARCEKNLRFTQFRLYSDVGCKVALFDPFTVTWDPCLDLQQIPSLPNSATFGSMTWIGGSHAQGFFACQFGHPCTDVVNEIDQDTNACSTGGGRRFGKIAIIP
ncbi:hypothetical protein QWA68_015306 [Fusarium oxysporum]|nr:hypothetical protein QWA68_015306 [Fusarium oxysporum]